MTPATAAYARTRILRRTQDAFDAATRAHAYARDARRELGAGQSHDRTQLDAAIGHLALALADLDAVLHPEYTAPGETPRAVLEVLL